MFVFVFSGGKKILPTEFYCKVTYSAVNFLFFGRFCFCLFRNYDAEMLFAGLWRNLRDPSGTYGTI